MGDSLDFDVVDWLSGGVDEEAEMIAKSPSMVRLSSNSHALKTKIPEPVNASTPVIPNTPRTIYLVTYSRADAVKVQSRRMFADIICREFQRPSDGDNKVVKKWACAAEIHPNTDGFHYHLCIQLNRQRRFKQVALNLKLKHDICVDFQPWITTYYDAFTYVKKLDAHYCTSENHPDLDNGPPKTSAAIQKKRKSTPQTSAESATTVLEKKSKPNHKAPRLEINVVSDIIIKNDIKNQQDFALVAKQQAKEGKLDLQRWVLSHSQRYRQEVINTAWLLENAEDTMERKRKTRLEILKDASMRECRVDNENGLKCEGSWLKAALEVLHYNNIEKEHFSQLVKNALQFGRGKGNNIMLIGPTNCAKSFMLAPLQQIYDCFSNPSNSAFNFVGAIEKEVFF